MMNTSPPIRSPFEFGFPDSVTIGNILRIIQVVMVLSCYVGFLPAVVHARDRIDRLYLLGGVALLTAIGIGSYVNFGRNFNVGTIFTISGMILWVVSAILSRERRRNREREGGSDSE